MAEVRQIPSAVGAFEAQIFDMSKTYQTIRSQAAVQAKAQQEAKKEADKAIAELSSARAGGRTQDLPYLNGLYNNVTNYYSKNSGRLQPGTEEYKTFNEMKANFLYETQRSKNEKEKQLRFDTYASVNSDKEKMSDDSLELVRLQRLALNDPKRTAFKKKTADDREIGIDNIDLPDLEKYSKFDEVELQKNIESVDKVDVETNQFVTKLAGYNLGAPVIQSKTVQMRRPGAVIDMYAGTFRNRERDAKDKLDREWSMLTPEQKDRVNAEFKTFNKVYEAAGIKEKVTIDESDKTAGISNGFEYGAYKALKNTLPMEIKQDFDTSIGNMIQSQRRFSAWWQNQKEKTQGQPVYKWIAQNLRSKSFNAQSVKEVINSAITSGAQAMTSATPAWFDINQNTKEATLLTNTPIKMPAADGKGFANVTTEPDAKKYAKKLKGGKWDVLDPRDMTGTNQEGIWQDPQSGLWFQRRIQKFDWSPSGVSLESRITEVINLAKQAQTSPESIKAIDAMMGEKTAIQEAEGSFIMNF
jgi:hypothetical protein